MPTLHLRNILSLLAVVVASASGAAFAQRFDFQLDRYEPTAAGSWTFAVDRPTYTDGQPLAAGLTFDYGHNPLVMGRLRPDGEFSYDTSIVSHQLVGHLEITGSFAERFQLSASLPVTLLERGTAVENVAPIGGMAVGDPRLTIFVRLWRHGDRSPLSVHAGTDLWVPIGADANHAGDATLRVQPKLVASGLLYRHVTHSVGLGMLFRPTGEVSSESIDAAAKIGHEVRLGAAAGWTDLAQSWHAGLEMTASTTLSNSEMFGRDSTSIEFLAGGQYRIRDQWWVGTAIGTGVMREPGTPDWRLIGRIAYAPRPSPDSDGDGTPDRLDACPQVKGTASPAPALNGCPAPPAGEELREPDPCPETPAGIFPKPCRPVGPLDDSDGDHVPDRDDQCPHLPAGDHPDPDKQGCPVLNQPIEPEPTTDAKQEE